MIGIALVSGACGIPIDDDAQVINPDVVEYGLLETTTSTTSTTVAVRPTQIVNFYWHNAADNRLEVVSKGRETEQLPGDALIDLVAGPLESDLEENPNLQTLLDITMEPALTGPNEAGVHQIRINRLAEEALTTGQAAEFVCTAVQFETIERVEIVDPEGTVFPLSGNGAVVLTEPARAEDFGNCEPDPLPTEETTTTIEVDGGSTTSN